MSERALEYIASAKKSWTVMIGKSRQAMLAAVETGEAFHALRLEMGRSDYVPFIQEQFLAEGIQLGERTIRRLAAVGKHAAAVRDAIMSDDLYSLSQLYRFAEAGGRPPVDSNQEEDIQTPAADSVYETAYTTGMVYHTLAPEGIPLEKASPTDLMLAEKEESAERFLEWLGNIEDFQRDVVDKRSSRCVRSIRGSGPSLLNQLNDLTLNDTNDYLVVVYQLNE